MQLPDTVQLRFQRFPQVGAVADLLGDDVRGARKSIGSTSHAFLLVYIIFRCDFRIRAVARLKEEQIGKRLQAFFLRHGGAGAALLFVGAVKVFQFRKGACSVDGGGKLLGELALLFNGGEDGLAPLLKPTQILQAGFQRTQHGVVHRAVQFFAVTRNKRNGVTLVQESHNIPDIICLLAEFFGQNGDDPFACFVFGWFLFHAFHFVRYGFLSLYSDAQQTDLCSNSAVFKYLQQRPGQIPSFPRSARVDDFDAAHVLVERGVRMAVQSKLRAGFLCSVDEAVHPAVIYMVQMPVSQECGDRTELHCKARRSLGCIVAVAADMVKRNVRKLPQQDFRIPLIIPKMHQRIRHDIPHGLHHRGSDSVGIGKNRNSHGSLSLSGFGIS